MAEPGTLCAWRVLVLQLSAAFRRVGNLTPLKPLPAWPWHKPRAWLAEKSNVAENGPGSCLHGATDAAQAQLTSDPSLAVLAALCLLPSHSLVSEPAFVLDGQHKISTAVCQPDSAPLHPVSPTRAELGQEKPGSFLVASFVSQRNRFRTQNYFL